MTQNIPKKAFLAEPARKVRQQSTIAKQIW